MLRSTYYVHIHILRSALCVPIPLFIYAKRETDRMNLKMKEKCYASIPPESKGVKWCISHSSGYVDSSDI